MNIITSVKKLRKCEVDILNAKPVSIIDPNFKENGCHQKCPEGYDVYNEDWFLSPKGDMCNRCSGYYIEADKLRKDDWILHCMERRWFDANTFIPAYWEACRRAGIKKVTMRIEY